jgi:tetratricopeptide (TPR) repeat protein
LARRVGSALRWARQHPKTAALLALLVLAGVGAGLHGYALWQWHAAERALREDRPAEARERLAFCLRLWPLSPQTHLRVARVDLLLGHLDAAESHLNRCLRLQNGATEPVQLQFLLLRVQAGEGDEVAPELIAYVDHHHPETPLILETLARDAMHRLRYRDAYAYLSRWIEETPDAAKPYHWRGWVQERLSNPQHARQDYERALERNPDLTRIRLRVAEMLLADQKPVEALPHLERLIHQLPDNPEVQARLGQCRFVQGQTEEARRLLEGAVARLPEDLVLLLTLSKLDLEEGRPVEAEQWVRRALRVDPFDVEAEYALVSCLQSQGRRAEAATALERSTKHRVLVARANKMLLDEANRPSTDPDKAAELGSLLLQIGKDQLGVHWLEQALVRDPTYQPAHKALVEFYEQKGEANKAAAHRRRLHPPQPQGGKR